MSVTTSAPGFCQPHTFVALRLPSGTHKVIKLVPDTTIHIGKYGSFHTNSILGRPYYLTFEILDKTNENSAAQLRIVTASELHAEAIAEDATPSDSRDETVATLADDAPLEVVGTDGEILIRNNRLTMDDATTQALTMEEIEELKKIGTGSGREIIAKIMQSHAALDKKTAFSLEKYTLRKRMKYMRRFTLLPLDLSTLVQYTLNEKESGRIMEIREETLGLVTAWLNVHYAPVPTRGGIDATTLSGSRGRWLVVDDTSGLMVAAMAEKMGILYPDSARDDEEQIGDEDTVTRHGGQDTVGAQQEQALYVDTNSGSSIQTATTPRPRRKHRRQPPDAMSADYNTITLVHSASQPNVSILSYFAFDPTDTLQSGSSDSSSHPLHSRLKTLSWLQLISPHLDNTYEEPEVVPDNTLAAWKAGKRGTYYRKRRRWERVKRVVDETRAGGFDGLLVASATAPESILHHLVPLLRGGAQVVVYNPNVEALADLSDAYSSARRTAFLYALEDAGRGDETEPVQVPSEDFPLDPRLLLSTNLQTVRAREWQVLPGRTHPLMTSRGGAEGYVFTGTRALPIEGRVAARGTFAKKRKVDGGTALNGIAMES